MIALLALQAAANVVIQPSFEPPSFASLRPVGELAAVGPVDWTCSVRPPSGPEFIVAGHFEKPLRESMGIDRRMTLRIGGREPVSGSGIAGWLWMSRRDGRYWFEVKTPRIAEMDFIEPGQKGYIRLLSSRDATPRAPTIWQLEGLGFCTTTAKLEGEIKK